ncbi:hypothetical protein [Nannocystis pusilla]|uniref:Uncharacterized protein n=1 Tax=Nannocystis pusilla TaxID=889268 RepID=A0ABS7TP27_9BACT|nr:hypothetical protein [Nannocystis pusilla]MBZ5709998.1 hypothetical protein [Nannocystis pusilla]
MDIRATIVFSCILLGACGPGPGSSTDTVTSTDPTTSGATSTGGATGDTTTGTSGATTPTTGATATSDDTTTTGAPTTGTTGATTSPTTGGPLVCDDIVGSLDCAELVAVSADLTMETCMKCQGIPCGQEPDCDGQFPCFNDVIVIQGCCTDEQCEGLSPFCGMFIAADNVCVLSDDV